MSVTRDWLEKLHGRSPGYFSVVVFQDGEVKVVRAFDKSTLDTAAASIEATHAGDVYISCATYRNPPDLKSRGKGKNSVSIPGLWAEIDIDGPGHKPDPTKLPLPKNVNEALSVLDNLPEPTEIVHSGGGLHVWWLFDEPWIYTDTEQAQAATDDWQRLITQRAEEKGFSVDKVSDLARILRPPGTVNLKLKGNPRKVTLFKESGKRYPVVELASMGIPPAPRSHSEVVDESGLGGWEEILEPHGWQKIRERDDGAIEWRRPGKDSGSISAVSNPFGVPVLVNFSSDAGLPVGPNQRLTKFKVWAHLNYHGDLTAAKTALDTKKITDDNALIQRAEKYSASLIGWPEFWNEEEPELDWLAEPIIEQGRQIAIFSEAKAGKSLLMLEICALLASGQGIFGKTPHDPLSILYLDKENMRIDIRERLADMGFSAGIDLSNLHYSWFPDMPWFDKPEGGLDLLGLALSVNAKMVVLDTLSRVVEGEENSSDTYHDFYKHTGVWLKQRGITLVRLDHAGKDIAKGMRGSSSKTTDVDDVWELRNEGETVRLNRTHSRANHGASRIVLERFKTPILRHLPIETSIVSGQTTDPIELCMVAMDQAGIPVVWGKTRAYNAFKENSLRDKFWTQTIIQSAQTRRQQK